MRMNVRVQTADFDAAAEIAALRTGDPRVGAVASFIGTVRDVNDETAVQTLTLEHYPGMTERALAAIVERAKARFDIYETVVIHRVGELAPTDQIVLVAVTSAHRGEAFDACRDLVDTVKAAFKEGAKDGRVNGAPIEGRGGGDALHFVGGEVNMNCAQRLHALRTELKSVVGQRFDQGLRVGKVGLDLEKSGMVLAARLAEHGQHSASLRSISPIYERPLGNIRQRLSPGKATIEDAGAGKNRRNRTGKRSENDAVSRPAESAL